MLKIGEFSKLSRVSVRMLRHYDEIGLLKPAEIDRFTDYRYYREDQLPTAGRIAALKDMGFSLADIVKMLEVYEDRKQLEQFLSRRQRELEILLRDTTHRLTLLDAARERLRKEENMTYGITIKTIPERYAATVRMTVPRYEDEGTVWGILTEETCRMNLTEADPCLCAVTFLDGEYREENVELMAWKTVKGRYSDTEHVKFRTLPEVTAASCTFRGSYALITDVYAAVVAWIEANGYESDGPMFNIYHVSPHETQNPDEFVTEVCYPVKRKNRAVS
ncbi:MAG: MerR family transcriptional regulator [Oscillospiraceae bacterium]|nr:MerR family transcriptional regulator [Oscillospiraceae bacterium]